MPTEFRNGSQFTAVLIGTTDGVSCSFINGEHVYTLHKLSHANGANATFKRFLRRTPVGGSGGKSQADYRPSEHLPPAFNALAEQNWCVLLRRCRNRQFRTGAVGSPVLVVLCLTT